VDMHEFGQYYDPTLMAWRKNFDAHWAVSGLDRDTAEYRKWYYYLSSCAALFRARRINLWQFVFRKAGGFPYVSVR
jgi:cyclopropane-fatty-acyl-phospholipid synthase